MRHHDSIRVYVHSHGAPSQELAFHGCSPGACHLVKYEVVGRRVAKDEVSRDVWRPVAPVVAYVRRPVAAVWEGPEAPFDIFYSSLFPVSLAFPGLIFFVFFPVI